MNTMSGGLPALVSLSPTQIQSFGATARHLFRGAETLVEHRGDSVAVAFLAGQALESALKSCLLAQGMTVDELKKLGHRLLDLWRKAAGTGLAVPPAPPYWVERLNEGHSAPFAYRYPQDVHGVITPGSEQTIAGLRDILEKVETRGAWVPDPTLVCRFEEPQKP